MSFGEDVGALVAENSFGVLACAPGWERVPLGKLVRIVNGFPFESKFFSTRAGTPLARIRDVVRGRSDTFYAGPIPEGFWVRPGDLLVGMDGDFNSAHWRQGDALLNQRVCKLEASTARLNPAFLAYGLPGYLDLINRHTSSVTVKHLSSKTLQQVPFPLPSRDVQDQIVARIDALFAEIEEGEQALVEAQAGVETYRKALLKAAVTGELTADWRARNPARETGEALLRRLLNERRDRWVANPKNKDKRYVEPVAPDTADLSDLPDGWCWASVDQLTFVSGGVTVDSKRQPADPVEVPYLRVANVQRGEINLAKMKSITIDRRDLAGLQVQPGDILLNEGGDRDKVGRGWVWEGQIDVCIHQNHVFKARPTSTLVSPKLVSMFLNELGRRFFLDESKQTTNLASISRAKVIRAAVPLAPFEESAEALRLLAAHTPSSHDEIGEAAEASAILRRSVLAAAFRGGLIKETQP